MKFCAYVYIMFVYNIQREHEFHMCIKKMAALFNTYIEHPSYKLLATSISSKATTEMSLGIFRIEGASPLTSKLRGISKITWNKTSFCENFRVRNT